MIIELSFGIYSALTVMLSLPHLKCWSLFELMIDLEQMIQHSNYLIPILAWIRVKLRPPASLYKDNDFSSHRYSLKRLSH